MCMHTHILMMPLILVKESFVFHLRKNSEIRQGGQKSKVGIYLNKSMLSKGASLVVQRVKRLPAMQETWVWSPGLEDGEGNGNPLQYSCLETSMDRGAWWATVHGIKDSHLTEHLHFFCALKGKAGKQVNFFGKQVMWGMQMKGRDIHQRRRSLGDLTHWFSSQLHLLQGRRDFCPYLALNRSVMVSVKMGSSYMQI